MLSQSTQSILATLLITGVSLTSAAILPSCGDDPPAAGAGDTAGDSGPLSAGDCRIVEGDLGPSGEVPITVEKVATGLEVPWGIAFLPNDRFLVTERPGRVRLVENGSLVEQPVITVDLGEEGESGLLGIALHPDFGSNRQFFLYYTTGANGSRRNRVERFTLSEDSRSATRQDVVLDDIPAGVFHDGGRIRLGPDGNLYIGTGDARDPELSQDRGSLAGKILRIAPDGSVPPDNPIEGSPVYLLGIRNTQGFDWLNDETLVVTDHGPTGELGRSGGDEVTIARAGDNLGWPTAWLCQESEGMQTPSLVWRNALPPGGAAIYTGSAIPEWQGDLIIGTLRSRHLHRVILDEQDGTAVISGHEVYLDDEYGRLREVIMGPDGNLYVTTSNCDSRGSCPAEKDMILRVTRR